MAYFNSEQIKEMFTYHAPPGDYEIRQHEAIRTCCLDAANRINGLVPDCQEKTLAIRALQVASMWANAALALNRHTPTPDNIDRRKIHGGG